MTVRSGIGAQERERVCRSQQSGARSAEAREGLPEEETLPEGREGVCKASVLLSPWGRKDGPAAFSAGSAPGA